MKYLILAVITFVFVSFVDPRLADGQSRRSAKVVAKFGGECKGISAGYSSRLKRLIGHTEERRAAPCDSAECERAFTYDLNGDGKKEYFIRLSCGGTGNCIWGIFADNPAQSLGSFTAWFFYIHKRVGRWSTLTTYTREGGDQAVIANLANRKKKYLETSERTEKGYYGNPQPFLTRMGILKCD